MSGICYYNVKRPSGKDKTWEAIFMLHCKELKINYVRRNKKGVVSFDISCSKKDYEDLIRLMGD